MPVPASAFNTFPPDTRVALQKPKLLDRVRAVARVRHPLFLSHLTVEGRVSASTQNVALCALLFRARRLSDARVGTR